MLSKCVQNGKILLNPINLGKDLPVTPNSLSSRLYKGNGHSNPGIEKEKLGFARNLSDKDLIWEVDKQNNLWLPSQLMSSTYLYKF